MKYLVFLLLSTVIGRSVKKENNMIINMINKERKNLGLNSVVYDNELDKELKGIRQSIGNDAWWYESGNQSSSFEVNNITRTNDLKGAFLNLTDGNRYIWRDTMRGYRGALKIVRMRLNQRNCLDLNKCSNETFNNFVSCTKYPIILQNSLPCSWATSYYSMLVLPSLKSFAILRLSGRGRYVPDKLKNIQLHNFWLYGKFDTQVVDNQWN